MDFFFDHIEDLTPAERKRLLNRLERDDDLRRDYEVWKALAVAVRGDQERILGDTELLVAYALDRGGYTSVLSAAERRRLEEVGPVLDEARKSRPGVADIVAHIQEDADLFGAEWRSRFEADGRSGVKRLPDRAAAGRERLRAGEGSSPYGGTRGGHSRVLRLGWRVAAAAAAVVFVGILLFVGQREDSRITVEVDAGAVEELSLPDGSNVRLVGPATLSYVPSRTLVRPSRMALSGDAYFDVTSGDVPFVVETATARVSVLGTNFGVRSLPERTHVVLVSGRLSVFGLADEAGLVLEPGFASSVPRGGSPSEPESVDLADALSWAGLFVFRGTSMADIAQILSDHYRTPVTVHPRFEAERFSGTFDRERDLRDILGVLATGLGARVDSSDDGFLLTGQAP